MNQPKNPTLLKTCSICGLQKPLSAFLELTGSQGTTYGNICAPCRKTGLEDKQKVKKTEAEGSTSSETGHGISSKTRVHEDIDSKFNKQRSDALDLDEKQDAEQLQAEIIEKKEAIVQKEKEHRKSFLEGRSYLTTPRKSDAEVKGEKGQVVEQQAKQAHGIDQVRKQEHGAKEEAKLTSVDFASGPVDHARVSGKVSLTFGVGVQALIKRLGDSSPFARAMKDASVAAGEKNGKAKETSLEEYVEETWKPTTRRT